MSNSRRSGSFPPGKVVCGCCSKLQESCPLNVKLARITAGKELLASAASFVSEKPLLRTSGGRIRPSATSESNSSYPTIYTNVPNQSNIGLSGGRGEWGPSLDSIKEYDGNSRFTSGGNDDFTEEDLIQFVDELSQQTCILKTRLVEMIGKLRKVECQCPKDVCLCSQFNENCVCGGSKEPDADCKTQSSLVPSQRNTRTRGAGSFPYQNQGELESNRLQKSIYQKSFADEQRLNQQCQIFKEQPTPMTQEPQNQHRASTQEPQNQRSSNGTRSHGRMSDPVPALIEASPPSPSPSEMSIPRKQAGINRTDNKRFNQTVEQIQQDIEALKSELKYLTECSCSTFNTQ